jgi:hypothetical protein
VYRIKKLKRGQDATKGSTAIILVVIIIILIIIIIGIHMVIIYTLNIGMVFYSYRQRDRVL